MRALRRQLIGMICLIVAAPALAQSARTTDYGLLFDKMAQTIQDNFYEPTLRGLDWSGLRARIRPVAARASSDARFIEIASELLRSLRASHLDLMPPQRSGSGGGRGGMGARFEQIEGQWIVSRVAPLSDARRKGIRPGDRLLASPDATGGGGSAETYRIETCRGENQAVQILSESAFWPPERPTFRWSRISSGQGKSIAYLRVDGFEDDGAPMADRAMTDLADADAMIIDLRFNPGGNASALRLGSYFAGDAGPALGLLTREWLLRLGRPLRPADVVAAPRLDRAYTTEDVFRGLAERHGGAMLWSEDMGERRWRKPVVVLIGPDSGSAAEGFGWFMKLRTHALLVGRDTAGALLGSQIFELGSGWSLRVPVHGIWAPNGEDYGDRAVPPDLRVAQTREALCQGRDLDIEAALDAIRSGRARAAPTAG